MHIANLFSGARPTVQPIVDSSGTTGVEDNFGINNVMCTLMNVTYTGVCLHQKLCEHLERRSPESMRLCVAHLVGTVSVDKTAKYTGGDRRMYDKVQLLGHALPVKGVKRAGTRLTLIAKAV